MLEKEQLPPIQYNPETDKVLARYEPSERMGHRFYGFAPIAGESPDGYTELTYEESLIPLDLWQVKVNDDVVYQQSWEEILGDDRDEEETEDSYTGNAEEVPSPISAENRM